VLRHAINETRQKKADALVFVGDCMEENTDELCQIAAELGIHNVPAFLFHEGSDPVAEHAFRRIARLTNGAYCPFDARSALPARCRDIPGAPVQSFRHLKPLQTRGAVSITTSAMHAALLAAAGARLNGLGTSYTVCLACISCSTCSSSFP
jgi:hypothetical protein